MFIEHVRLILLLWDQNDLEVIAADIGNVYLHGKTREKLYTKIDTEGEQFKRKYSINDKSFYGLKTYAAPWHKAYTRYKLGFTPSKSDSD